jgi:hypothetical protein
MQRSISPFAIRLPAFALVVALTACDDVSPVDYRPPPQDATVPDADPEQIAACRECMLGDRAACRPEYDQCVTRHPLCASLTECLTDSNCWRQIDLANISDLPACALSCYEQSEVTSLNDIAAASAPLFICARTNPSCSVPCFGIGAPTSGEPDAAD